MDIDEFLDLQFDLDEQQEEFTGEEIVARAQKQIPNIDSLERSAGLPIISKRPLDEINLNAVKGTDFTSGDLWSLFSQVPMHVGKF